MFQFLLSVSFPRALAFHQIIEGIRMGKPDSPGIKGSLGGFDGKTFKELLGSPRFSLILFSQTSTASFISITPRSILMGSSCELYIDALSTTSLIKGKIS